MKRKWRMRPQDPERIARLATEQGCHAAVAAVLINRGITLPEHAERFLRPSLQHLPSPFVFKDMDKAVSRIVQALREDQNILIFGDYDVDGMTATALLFEFFSHAGAKVDYYIPDRLTEGYGLSAHAVSRHAASNRVDLIITVDCGITSGKAVAEANARGIDVVITDHHEPPDHLPPAYAIVNPKRRDCPSGLRSLAGVGVAFNLALALRKRLRDEGFWSNGNREPNLKAACDLVALGTVADMVPLVRENRIYVKTGLAVLTTSPRPGLQALIETAGLSGRTLDTRDLAFRLAPRLNAAGRLAHASQGCKLLTTRSHHTARPIAEELDRKNNQRRDMEAAIFDGITSRLDGDPDLLPGGLVLDSPAWHQGVIGIVASRLVNRYMRPVVLISVENGLGKGSARSPEGFDIFHAFKTCRSHLERFGGHAVAAGLTIKADNIAGFREAFQQFVAENTKAEGFVPTLDIDTELRAPDICPDLVDELDLLAPFGSGADEPLFVVSDLAVESAQTVGSGHTKMRLSPRNGHITKAFDAILFNQDIGNAPPPRFEKVACNVRWNHWMNRKRIQLIIKDFI